jgi:hypothetical protein
MDYIFNELSINQVETIHEVRSLLEAFVKTCIKAQNYLLLDTLRIPESIGNLLNISLVENYPLSKWCHDQEVDHDIKQKFYQIIANPPLLRLEEINELDTFTTSYFHFNLAESKGLGVAFLLQTLAVSFLTNTLWDNDNISITHEYFDEKENITSSLRDIKHCSKTDHVDSHVTYFNDLRRSLISKCSEIWENREELFPNLIFCEKTRKQLTKGISSKYVHQIYDRLLTLNEYLNSWQTGDFNLTDFVANNNVDCSHESDCTLRLYGDQRRFSIPNRGSEIFSLHIKTGDLRFHFYPESSSKKAYIGYIGSHLDTCTG